MRIQNIFRVVVSIGILLSAAGTISRAQSVVQSFTLHPGWNAIYLEVQPVDNSATAVFANLPASSVWTRAERLSAVDFIQDPSEAAFNNSGWLRWFHPSRPEAIVGNLFAVFANRAYLVKATNSSPVVWTVTGRPSLRTRAWAPDSYNLRGLSVDPAGPPSFLNFFRPSKAHFNAASGQLEKIYRLDSTTGQWQLAAPGSPMQSGAAYWIYTRGASDYLAPLSARVDLGDGLDFGSELSELNLHLGNSTAAPISASVREINVGGAGHLAHYQFSPTLGGQWPDFPASLAVATAANANALLRIAVRRQNFTGANYASILEIRDGAGTRIFVPVSAQGGNPAVSASGGDFKAFTASGSESMRRAGLWFGSATLNAVSEPHSSNPFQPTPTKSPLNLALIVHVDGTGQARLLKEVTQMWRNGTHTNNATGGRLVDKPGRYVLLTDDTLLPFFSGAASRDGESVGRRLSTVGYDFPSNSSNNFLNLSGAFAFGQTLRATLALPFDHPLNPYKHKYHPDHDNLNARFDGPAVESFSTSRQIELQPSAAPMDGPAAPDYGYNVISGTYRETITGIHKSAIHVSGTFRLSRVSLISDLNPSPTP